MHRRWRLFCGVAAAYAMLVISTVQPALAAPAGSEALDADAAVRLALSRNHDLQAARAEVESALGRLRQAGMWPNPRIELSYDTDRVFANDGAFSGGAGLSQDFPISGRLGLAEDLARVDVARALAEVNDAERKLISDVAAAYYDVTVLDESLKLKDGLIASVAEVATASRNRFQQGEVSELDVNAAALELLRLRQDRGVLAGERQAALRTLAGLIGLGGSEPLAIGDLPKQREPIADARELTELAIARRPDLKGLALAANRAEAEKALSSASGWEDWSLSLGVKRDRLVIEGLPRQPADDALSMTLTIPVPLLNSNAGSRDAATADRIVAREQAIALRQRIENEVVGLREQLVQLASTLDAFESDALPLARKNSQLAHSAYRKGQVSIADVVQAERLEKDISANYVDALSRYLKSRVALEAATVAHADLLTHPVDSKAGEQIR